LLGCHGDAGSVVLSRGTSSHGGLQGELLQQAAEEEEELGPGEALPRTPSPAQGEGHQPLLPPDCSGGGEEARGPAPCFNFDR